MLSDADVRDADKEYYKAQLKVHSLGVAANELGFQLNEDSFKPDGWQWGRRRSD
jgi:hypothetical protein